MTDPTAAAIPADQAGAADQPTGKLNMGRVLFIALVVGLFSVVWLVSYTRLNDLIWGNDFVLANRWTIPAGALLFSLLVGLVGKYMHAPNVINGGVLEPLVAGDTTGYKSFWGALLSSFFSLFSGASVGPEGPIGFLAVYISEWVAARLKLHKNAVLAASLAGMSSAYNGIVGNPLFAALFASESGGGRGGLPLVAANLAAGAVGYLIFTLLNVPPFASFLYEGELVALNLSVVLWAIALGLAGGLLAIYTGIAMQAADRVMSVFGDRIIARALAAGAIIGIVCFFVPNLMFSGEGTIQTIIADAAQIGIPMLLLMALVKPLLLSLSFKGGYLGGPIFPSLFAAIMLALAISLIAPQVPLEVLIACSAAGIVTLVLKAPLTSVLLVTVMTGADANLMGMIVVAVVAAMLLGGGFKSL
ncbi:MAG: chloride channel protein, partial [Caldilineales bacterium]